MDALSDTPEESGEGKWLSYGEISHIRGIGRESAVKLVQREKWRKQPGNDGSVRVLVPPEWLKPARERKREPPPEHSPDNTGEMSRVVRAFEAALGALREQIEQERDRAERAIAANDGIRADRERVEQALGEERAKTAALQARVEALLAQMAEAEANAKIANDRAWASGEALGAAREQLAALQQQIGAERKRADRAEKRADQERDELLDAESRAQRARETAEQRIAVTEKRSDEAVQARADAEAERDRLQGEITTEREARQAAEAALDAERRGGRFKRAVRVLLGR